MVVKTWGKKNKFIYFINFSNNFHKTYLTILLLAFTYFSNCTFGKVENKPPINNEYSLERVISAEFLRGELYFALHKDLENIPDFAEKIYSRPMYDVRVYKILYPVSYPQIGTQAPATITQSALLFVPFIGETALTQMSSSSLGWGVKNVSTTEIKNLSITEIKAGIATELKSEVTTEIKTGVATETKARVASETNSEVATLQITNSTIGATTRNYNNIGMGSFPLLIRFNSTIFSNEEAPTVCDFFDATKKCDSTLALLEASQGFIVLLPDYLGFGESRDKVPFHPFFIPEYYQYDALSLLNNVAGVGGVADKLGIEIKKRKIDNKKFLFLTGYSEGGYATLAVQKFLEEKVDSHPYFITASAPGAASVNLNIVAKRIMGRDFFVAAPFLANVLLSYNYIYGLNYQDEEIYKKGTNSVGVDINLGTVLMDAIKKRDLNIFKLKEIAEDKNNWYDTSFKKCSKESSQASSLLDDNCVFNRLSDSVNKEFFSIWADNCTSFSDLKYIKYTVCPPKNSPPKTHKYFALYEKLEKNSLSGWGPSTPTRLYHCSVDLVVPSPMNGLHYYFKLNETSQDAHFNNKNIIEVNEINIKNSPDGSLGYIGKGISTMDFGNQKYLGHSTCPLISAGVPWFVTFLNK